MFLYSDIACTVSYIDSYDRTNLPVDNVLKKSNLEQKDVSESYLKPWFHVAFCSIFQHVSYDLIQFGTSTTYICLIYIRHTLYTQA